MSKWSKIKAVKTMVKKEGEEEEEEDHLYEILDLPDPKYKFKFLKPVTYFMRRTNFTDSETKTEDEMMPDFAVRRKYMLSQPFEKCVGNHTSMAHSDMNTEAKTIKVSNMNHVEGGWPEHVRTEMIEHKNKFIRQTCKEDMFKWTVTGLIKRAETVLKQNNTMDIEEIYFDNMTEDTGSAQSLTVKTLAKFKDFSKHRRPVSNISWKLVREPQVAISYCSSEFLGMYGELCSDCYVFNLEHTTKPLVTFNSPDHVTIMDYNDKTPDLVGGGCYRGQVCWWDERVGGYAVGQSEFEVSHSDAVYTFKWIGKTGTEFFTGSSDGYIKWWDIRNIKEAVRQYKMESSYSKNPDFPPGINSLSFEPTIPSKFMVGTEQGGVIITRMQAKAGTNDWVLGEFEKCHQGKVMSVDRNPFYPKNFLTIGDTTCRIWCEDLKTSAIMWMKPSAARLTGGGWSPTKISVFFTTRVDGYVEVWDFLHNHQVPILNIKVADSALNCVKIHESGRLLCVGASDGTTSLIQLDESLATCSKLDRTNANDMFDRETRRERILFNREKALKVAEKQKAMAAKTREFERKQQEELLIKNGCPIKRAEKQFFDHIAKVTAERVEREKELRNASLI